MKPVIEMNDVWYRYPMRQDWMLKGIDARIDPGEWISVVGANGSGKSTWVQLLNGLLKPTQGKVFVDGLDTSLERNLLTIRKQLGIVFQDPDNQVVRMTVGEEVAFGLRNIGVPSAEVEARVEQALQMTGLFSLRDCSPHALSGGQKQRLAASAVLAMRPRVVVFDEATSMLDPWSAQSLLEMMGDLRQAGVTVIQVTQEMEEILHSDRVFVMGDGQMIGVGRPSEVITDRELLQNAGLVPPFVARLRAALSQEGVSLPNEDTSLSGMAESIWKSFLMK